MTRDSYLKKKKLITVYLKKKSWPKLKPHYMPKYVFLFLSGLAVCTQILHS